MEASAPRHFEVPHLSEVQRGYPRNVDLFEEMLSNLARRLLVAVWLA